MHLGPPVWSCRECQARRCQCRLWLQAMWDSCVPARVQACVHAYAERRWDGMAVCRSAAVPLETLPVVLLQQGPPQVMQSCFSALPWASGCHLGPYLGEERLASRVIRAAALPACDAKHRPSQCQHGERAP